MRRALVVVLAWLATAAPGTAAPGSGVDVTVVRGPTTPVCPLGAMCVQDDPRVPVIVRHAGLVVAHAATGDNGRVRIRLAAGRYLVQVRYRYLGRIRVESARVSVNAHAYAPIRFTLDSGIR